MISSYSKPPEKKKDGGYRLRQGDVIHYEDEDSFQLAKILSRSGKASSDTLKNRFNVESNGCQMRLDLEHVLCLETVIEEDIVVYYDESSYLLPLFRTGKILRLNSPRKWKWNH